jgi:hypothetical protein
VEWYGSVRELMWADGRRTLADIARLLQLHGPVLYNDKVLARLRKLFRFLERHGYLEMKKG